MVGGHLQVVVERRGAGKMGLAQGWIPFQRQELRLLRVRERGPERTLFRGLELALLRTQARKPLRQQGRVLLRVPGQGLERWLLQVRKRGLGQAL
ncbi:MAG TPA: hypothetical protein VMH22_10930 [bacterium]|nr:hypothetical protein [bacterium]